MRHREYLLQYAPMANFIRDMNGPGCEVVIHDLSDLEHSIAYITEPSLTSRTVGGAITDYALSLLQNREFERSSHVVNYLGCSGDDERVFRSSTYFVKRDGDVIGLICVNIDISDLVLAEGVIHRALLVDVPGFRREYHRENLTGDLDEAIGKVVEAKASGADPQALSLDTRREIVRELHARGVFMLKGAIHKMAEIFGVSNQTIYRYVDEAANNEATNNASQAQ